jgi:hypothetical protein
MFGRSAFAFLFCAFLAFRLLVLDFSSLSTSCELVWIAAALCSGGVSGRPRYVFRRRSISRKSELSTVYNAVLLLRLCSTLCLRRTASH